MKKTVLAVLCMVLGWAVVGSAQQLAEDQTLRIAFDVGDVASLDPHFATTTLDRSIVNPVFNALVRYPPGNQVGFEPDLSESWEVSDDGLVWTFHLRQGVYFHPFPGYPEGYELTAEDVVYSFEKAANPARSAFAGDYTGMQFLAVDRYTFQIALDHPMSETLFLAKVANNQGGLIVCKRALEENGDDWFRTHPVGTGPFMFSSYTPMDRVVLARNGRYFQGVPVLERVEYICMPDLSSRELGLRTGELEIIEGLKEKVWLDKVAGFPEVVGTTFGPCETQVLHFNMAHSPFDDIRIRQTVAYAIDREAIAAYMGMAVPIYSPAMAPPAPGALTYEEAKAAGVAYETNREKAHELLTEAGYPDGFSCEVIISEMASSYLKPMQIIQAQLREVGIDVKLRVVEHSTFHSLTRQDASPLVYYACWRPDVDVFLTRFYHSDSVVVTGGKPDTNFSHYGAVDTDGDGKIDSLDGLIEQARWELNPEEQVRLWKTAQIKILEDMAAFPVIRLEYCFPMKSYVDLGYPVEYIWTCYSPPITEKARILTH